MTVRSLFCPSVNPFHCLYIYDCPFTLLTVRPSILLITCPSFSQSFWLFVHLTICPYYWLSVFLTIRPSEFPFFWYPSACPPVHPSDNLHILLSVRPSDIFLTLRSLFRPFLMSVRLSFWLCVHPSKCPSLRDIHLLSVHPSFWLPTKLSYC